MCFRNSTHKPTDIYAALRYDPEYVLSLKKTNKEVQQRPSSIPRPVAIIDFKKAPRYQ